MQNITITPAHYRPLIPALETNRFSRALPDYYPDEAISQWEQIPVITETMRALPASERMTMAHSILDQTFLVFPEFLTLVHSMDRMIHRTAENPEYARMMILSGNPGTGKKTAIRHALSHYPDIILHTFFEQQFAPGIQIPCIKISAPADHSLRTLRNSITDTILKILTPLQEQLPLFSIQKCTPEQLLHELHVSLLIVNLRFLGSTAAQIHLLTDYFSALMHSGISVLFLASEEQSMLISANIIDAMDLRSESILRLQGLRRDSFYEQWIQKIWQCLVVPGPEITSDITGRLHSGCYGNPALIIRSLKEAQVRALSLNRDHFDANDLSAAVSNSTSELAALQPKDKTGDPS